jgi:hypothetical protein
LGSLFDLDLSISVDVTFMENVFPFRKFNKHRESPASLLWGTENNMAEGDPRLGMFDPDTSGASKILDRHALKSIGALPAANCPIETDLQADLPDTKTEEDHLKLKFDALPVQHSHRLPSSVEVLSQRSGLWPNHSASGTHGVPTSSRHTQVR